MYDVPGPLRRLQDLFAEQIPVPIGCSVVAAVFDDDVVFEELVFEELVFEEDALLGVNFK